MRLGDEVKPGALLAELDTGSLENRIAQQKVIVRKAHVTSDRAVALGRDKFERELASLDVELAGLQMQDLRAQMDESKLLCTVGGTVVYLRERLPRVRGPAAPAGAAPRRGDARKELPSTARWHRRLRSRAPRRSAS